MRSAWIVALAASLMCGCSGKKSSLLLERRVRGSISEDVAVGKRVAWRLDPVAQTKIKGDIDVYANYASPEFLENFFQDHAVFGPYAGKNPFFPEHLVFYVKIANKSDQKIYINPVTFVVTDDRGNQYPVIGVDYITAFAEYRKPVSTMTRGVLEEARPGYFGIGLPVGKLFASKPQGRFALLSMATLKTGPLAPGTVYDGLISFWNPHAQAKTLHLMVTDIKTDFDANDLPRASHDFVFDFTVVTP